MSEMIEALKSLLSGPVGGAILAFISVWVAQRLRAGHARRLKEGERRAELIHESIRKPLLDHCRRMLEGHSEAFWRYRGGDDSSAEAIDWGAIQRSVAVVQAGATALNVPYLRDQVDKLGTAAILLRMAISKTEDARADVAMKICIACYSNVLVLMLDPTIRAAAAPDFEAVADVERTVLEAGRSEGPK